jgi:hypothetical protein
MTEELDLFHYCALWAYVEAMQIDKHLDSDYVKRKAYRLYERELQREKADR